MLELWVSRNFVISTEGGAFCRRSGETSVLVFAFAFLAVIPVGNLLSQSP
jgi:hypothetical protein